MVDLTVYHKFIISSMKQSEYITFKEQNTKHFTKERSVKDINNLNDQKILDVFSYIYNMIINSKFEYVSITKSNIQKKIKVSNQTLSFIINYLEYIKVIDKYIQKTKGKSNKYKIMEINNEYQELNNLIIPITFNKEILKTLKKQRIKYTTQLSRLKNKSDSKEYKEIFKKRKDVNNFKILVELINDQGGFTEEMFNEKHQKSGRISFFITTIKKQYRDYLLLNNENTNTCDVVNSQPAFFSIELMKDDFYNTKKDVKLFYDLCTTGNFYDYISKELKITRENAKNLWMTVAYGLPYFTTENNEIRDIINKKAKPFFTLFPNVTLALDSIKSLKKENKHFSSEKLSKYESKHINKMSEILTNNGITNITIYDEIIYAKKYNNIVKELIKKYITENNLNIQLKYSNDNNEIITSNDIKTETNMINQEEKESSLEELITKKDYEELLSTKDWWNKASKNKMIVQNKYDIFEMLIASQEKSSKKIKQLITEYIKTIK